MSSRQCSQCGTPNLAESNFCSRCGAPLAAQPQPPRVPQAEAEAQERKLVSIFFADIVESTAIVEDLDPEDALDQLNPAIQAMRGAVKRFGGTLCREQGDGVMAFFGAPRADDHHAVNACLAGLEIVRAVEHLTHREMKARVGIHSGEVVVRLIEGEFGPSYDASGASVYLANRLESLARPGTVMVSAATLALAAPYFDFVSEPPVVPKGFTQPMPVFSISGQRSISRWMARRGKGFSPFVGRKAELQCLHQISRDVENGGGQIALVCGNAGSGKSRLAHEFIAGLATEGWSIIEAEAQPAGQATPYGVLKRMVLSWLGCSELDGAATVGAALEQRLKQAGSCPPWTPAALRSILDLPVGDPAWAETELGFRRRHVINAIKFVVGNTAKSFPLVSLVEDFHWIDAESAHVIEQLEEDLAGMHLLILGTARSVSPPATIGRKQSRIELAALDEASGSELLDALLGTEAGLSELKKRLLSDTGGVPIFMEEVVRRLTDTGALVGERGAYTLTIAPEDIGIPLSVQNIIATRVDALPAPAKRVLQSAAVLTKPISVSLLMAMSELSDETLRAVLQQIEDAGFLTPVRMAPDTEYAFAHELMREVIYSALMREQRRALHGKALVACLQVLSDRANEFAGPLSHHAYESQNWSMVLRFSRQAAARALERSAFREAAVQYQRAIESISKQSQSRTLNEIAIDVRLQARLALSATSQLAVWIEYAKEAEEMAAAISDPRRELTAIINRAQALTFAGSPAEAIELTEAALRRTIKLGLHDLELLAWFTIAQAHYAAGNFRKSVDILSGQIERLRGENVLKRLGTTSTTSVLYLTMIGIAASSLGAFDQARPALEEAATIAEQTGRPYDAVSCCYGRGLLAMYSGDAGKAITELRKGLDVCREYSINLLLPLIVGQLGAALTEVGSHDQAIRLLDRMVRESKVLGHNAATAFATYALAAAYRAVGRHQEAVDLVEPWLESATRYGLRAIEMRLLHLLGMLKGDQGEPAAAEALLSRSIELAKTLEAWPTIAHGQLALAEHWAKAGEPVRASEATDAAISIYQRLGCAALAQKAQASRQVKFGNAV
jgi:class 3 adenylate cyclase/predicted ATPase